MDEEKKPIKRWPWQRILRIAAGALFFAALCAVAVLVLREGIDVLMPASLPLAACVLLALYAVKSVVVIIPFVTFFLYAGLAFPPVWAVIITYAGLALDLSIGHFLGKRLGVHRVLALLEERPRVARLLAIYRANMKLACVVMRTLPVPFELTSMFFGASGLGYGWHVGLSLLAVTPYALPYVLAGEAIENPLSARFLVPVAITVVVAVGAVLLMWRIERRGRPGGKDAPEA